MSKLTIINMQNCTAAIRAYRDADVSSLTPDQLSARKRNAELASSHLAKLSAPTRGVFGGVGVITDGGPECIDCGFMIEATP